MAFNVNLIGPILGELQAEFDVSLPVLGLLLSMQAVARAVAIVPAGFLADRLPPHTPLTAGTLCTAAGCAISALALDYRVLLAGVLVTGLGTALVYTTGLAHTVRSSEGSDRSHTAGRILAAVQMGALLAPILSGVAASTFGWRAAFALGALVGGIAALRFSQGRAAADVLRWPGDLMSETPGLFPTSKIFLSFRPRCTPAPRCRGTWRRARWGSSPSRGA